MQKLYQAVTGNINAARLQTLESNEATEEHLEQLESYATECLQGCSLLTRFWKIRQKPGRGMDVILEALDGTSQQSSGPQTGADAVRYDSQRPETASPAPELLAKLLNAVIADDGYPSRVLDTERKC